jgi:hypothetical protein
MMSSMFFAMTSARAGVCATAPRAISGCGERGLRGQGAFGDQTDGITA